MAELKCAPDVERWMKKLQADRLCSLTLRKHSSHVSWFFKYIQKEPKDVTMEDIEKWRYEANVIRGYEPYTTLHNFISLRKFFRFIGRNEFADKIEMPEKPKAYRQRRKSGCFQMSRNC